MLSVAQKDEVGSDGFAARRTTLHSEGFCCHAIAPDPDWRNNAYLVYPRQRHRIPSFERQSSHRHVVSLGCRVLCGDCTLRLWMVGQSSSKCGYCLFAIVSSRNSYCGSARWLLNGGVCKGLRCLNLQCSTSCRDHSPVQPHQAICQSKAGVALR